FNKINLKTPDALKNIHTVTFFSIFLAIINKQAGDDKLYSNHKKYFEKDGIVKRKVVLLHNRSSDCKGYFIATGFLADVYPKIDMNEIIPNSAITEFFGVNVGFSNGE
ncbi:12726_t:CDS:2, partial [Racocetra persica]